MTTTNVHAYSTALTFVAAIGLTVAMMMVTVALYTSISHNKRGLHSHDGGVTFHSH